MTEREHRAGGCGVRHELAGVGRRVPLVVDGLAPPLAGCQLIGLERRESFGEIGAVLPRLVGPRGPAQH